MKKLKKILVWISASVGFIITILLVAWAIMNAIWGAELRKTIAEIKARGEPMTIAEIVPAYVPPEKNAAVEFHKFFALMCGDKPDEQYIPFKQGKIKPNVEALNDYFRKKSLNQVSAEETKKAFELADSPEFTGIFDALNAAALKPDCNFDLNYEDGVETLLPNLGFVRTSARLQSLKALSLANRGNISGTCDMLMTAFQISNHIQSEPFIVHYLLSVACFSLTTETLNNIADNFQIPDENAKRFIAELEKINTTEPLKKSLIAERVCVGQTIFEQFISGKYGYDYAHNISPNDNHFRGPRLVYFFIWKPFLKRDYCEYLRIMALYPDVCVKSFYSSREKLNKIETDIRHIPFYCLFSRLFTPSLTKIFERNAEFQTKLAISKIKLALVIYKGKNAAFPENLEQLKPDILKEIPIDELTGNPLTYKREGGKYVLFSDALRELEAQRKKDAKK